MDSKCRKAIFKKSFHDIYKENQCKGEHFAQTINLKTRKLMVDLHILLGFFKGMIVKMFKNLNQKIHKAKKNGLESLL